MHDFETLLAELDADDAIELILATGRRATVRHRDGRAASLTTRPLTPGELRDVITGTPLTATVRRATPEGVEDSVEVGGRAYRVRAVRAGVAVALHISRPQRPLPGAVRTRGVYLPTPAPMRGQGAPPATAPGRGREGPSAPSPARAVAGRGHEEPAPRAGLGLRSPGGAARPAPLGSQPAEPPRRGEARPTTAGETSMGAAASGPAEPKAPLERQDARAPVAPAPSPTLAPSLGRPSSARPLAQAPAAPAAPRLVDSVPPALVALIEAAREVRAADLYVLPGAPPQVRTVEGLSPLGSPVPRRELDGFAEALAASPAPARVFPGDQVRVTATPGQGGVALHLRLYPRHRPSLEDLGLVEVAARLGDVRRGLILVGSRRGHGRGTTRDALTEHLASTYLRATVSLAPTSVCYEGGRTRWWGGASPDEALALAEAEDVEVLALPDLETPRWIEVAQRAVESGRVVLATVACRAGGEVVTRVLDGAPAPDELGAFLAGELRLALFQELFPAAAGPGVVAGFETLWGGPRLWATLQAAAEAGGRPALDALLARRGGADARSLLAAAQDMASLGRIHERELARLELRTIPAMTPLETRGQVAEGDRPTPNAPPRGGRPAGLGERLGSLFRSKDERVGAKGTSRPERRR